MNKLVKQLIIIKSKKLTVEKAKGLGINIQELKNKGFIIINSVKSESITVPNGVPKYAAKFKFTRRKYGIDVKINEEKSIKITEKGIKFIAKSVKKPEEEIKEDIKEDNNKQIIIEENNENQD